MPHQFQLLVEERYASSVMCRKIGRLVVKIIDKVYYITLLIKHVLKPMFGRMKNPPFLKAV